MEKLRIVVGGFIGLYPTGGVTWDYIQYPLGLKLLGHDVYYIEDTFQFPKFQKNGRHWNDATDSIEYLKNTMEQFDMGNKWAYRDVFTGSCFGMTLKEVKEVCRTADIFINVSASTFLRDEYLQIPKRVFIDSDPMFTQIEYAYQKEHNKDGNRYRMDSLIENHNYHFSFGENIGAQDCSIPVFDFDWKKTRQPVCLELWKNKGAVYKKDVFTTVMNWSVSTELIYENKTWGQKNSELEKLVNIPAALPHLQFEMMIANIPDEKLTWFNGTGWKILNPLTCVASANAYKNFILSSAAEFSVAKETYVKSKSGWFSCRSACYLAAGKPVITQDTGWSSYLRSGDGLFAFRDEASAIDAIKEVAGNYHHHSQMAEEIASEYFDSNKVLSHLIDQLDLTAENKNIIPQ
jgi:hypothetical protein